MNSCAGRTLRLLFVGVGGGDMRYAGVFVFGRHGEAVHINRGLRNSRILTTMVQPA